MVSFLDDDLSPVPAEKITSIKPGKYRCVRHEKDEAVWTLVARRR
jgi:hypothetical protein